MEAIGIKLASAVLCEDCETITQGRNNCCELCASIALLPLAPILNRQMIPASEPQHMFGTMGIA
jgi:hypothetical protein